MTSRPLMRLRFETAAIQDVGATANGVLTIFPITGGTFEGDRLRGRVLTGADWVTRKADGSFELDARVTLETSDGAVIYLTFTGVRDDAHHYFRTVWHFETGAPAYAFLNRLLAIGAGEITQEGPVHVIDEVL
jgi:hypothetical protein